MEFLMKLVGVLAEGAKFYFKPLTRVGALIWKFWLNFWDHSDSSAGSKIDAWFESWSVVRFVNKYVWIFLGAITVFVVGVFTLATVGILPSGVDETNLLDYICAGLFLSWAIVEWFLDGVRHLVGSMDVPGLTRYGLALIFASVLVLFSGEIMACVKKFLNFVKKFFKFSKE